MNWDMSMVIYLGVLSSGWVQLDLVFRSVMELDNSFSNNFSLFQLLQTMLAIFWKKKYNKNAVPNHFVFLIKSVFTENCEKRT